MNIVDKIKLLENSFYCKKKQIDKILINSMYNNTFDIAEKMIKEIYDNNIMYVKISNLIEKLYKIKGVTGKVLQLKYENDNITMEKISQILQIPLRTLYRQLKKEGSEYEYL